MKKLLLLSLLSLNVYAADPTYDVTKGALQNNPDLCAYGYNPSCNRGNNSQYSPPPPKRVIETTIIHKASKYGALALDEKTSALGGAINSNSLSEAKKAAIRQCGEKGCKVITWVRNGCIAAAGGKAGKYWKLAKAAEPPGKAEPLAMKRCQAMGVSDCQIVIPEACSVPDGMYD